MTVSFVMYNLLYTHTHDLMEQEFLSMYWHPALNNNEKMHHTVLYIHVVAITRPMYALGMALFWTYVIG